jgi:sn-glycerol 3-phosphate transport system permease protein
MRRSSATINAWLLLLPAMTLLALSTHWPALAIFIDSFYSTPRPRRGATFVGLENYRQIIDDPIFWQALTNNLLLLLARYRCRLVSPCSWRFGSTIVLPAALLYA